MKKQLQLFNNRMARMLGVTLLSLGFSISLLSAQTILIDSAGAGGFELGADFASNGWIAVNGTATNKWFVGNSATPFSGSRSAFVDNGTGSTNAYTITTASTVHFYRDITFPSGETKITLNFRWKAQGEGSFDYLTVYTVPITVTPSFNLPVGAVQSWLNVPTNYPGAVIRCAPVNLNLQNAYQTQNILLPATFAGTTQRIVFMWSNDGSLGAQPPGSVDNIHLTSTFPSKINSTTIGGLWSNPSTWVGGVVPNGDSAEIAAGANVTLDIPVSAATFSLLAGSTFSCNAAMSIASDLNIAIGATYNGFFGTTGSALAINGNIINNGTLNVSMPGASVTLGGTTAQTISGSGNFSLMPTLTVNNLAGVVVNSNLTISNALNLTNGVISGSGNITLGNASFNPTFVLVSTGGTIASNVVSGFLGMLPGSATFTYNSPTPIASITTGNELNIVAPTVINVIFNAIAGGNYILGTDVSVNNLTLNDTLIVNSPQSFTLNGLGLFGVQFISGSGTFSTVNNATLSTNNQLGITAFTNNGSIQTATRNYNPNANYTFAGASGQVTGNGLPAILTGGTVTISTTAGTLLSQATVFNNLTLTTNLLLGSNSITVNRNAIIATLAITGSGTFTAGSSSRLFLNSTAANGALSTIAATGNIQNTGGRIYTSGLDIVLGGTALATGNDFPLIGIDSLVLNHTSAAVLTNPTAVNTLNISNTGRLTTTAINMLSVVGALSENVTRTSTGYIDGPLTRTIGVGASGAFVFPLGAVAVGNLGIEVINPVVTGASITLTAVARSLSSGGSTGTGLTALATNRYWAFAPIGGSGLLSSVRNIRIFESTVATLGGIVKKIGFTTLVANGIYNSIGGQLDSSSVTILSSAIIPAFGTVSDSTFLVLGAGVSSGVFTGGTYSVGPTGTYFSLTSALAAINERTSLSAPVILEFQNTYNPNVETYPIVFRATLPTTAINTITVRPNGFVTNSINFAGIMFNGLPLIDFNGGKNIIIDGRPAGLGTNRFLSFDQKAIGALPTIRFLNDAQNITLRRINVQGNNTSTTSGIILFSTTNGIGGNSTDTIDFCTVNGLANSVNCIFASGSIAPADNKNVVISNNNIFDFFLNGSSPTGLLVAAVEQNLR